MQQFRQSLPILLLLVVTTTAAYQLTTPSSRLNAGHEAMLIVQNDLRATGNLLQSARQCGAEEADLRDIFDSYETLRDKVATTPGLVGAAAEVWFKQGMAEALAVYTDPTAKQCARWQRPVIEKALTAEAPTEAMPSALN